MRIIGSSVIISLLLFCAQSFAVTDCCHVNPNDPLETLNRRTFEMNRTLDTYILKPIATMYIKMFPKVVRIGVHNFYSNLREIPTFINDVLQLKFMDAATDGWRFTINSTVGIFGLVDVAQYMDMPPHEEDFGLTLARWGYTDSSYFVLPFYGPSTIRDAFAMIPYFYMTVYAYISPITDSYALLAGDIIDMRAQLLSIDDLAQQAAIDPYTFQRNAYLQHRAYRMGIKPETADPYDLMDAKPGASS